MAKRTIKRKLLLSVYNQLCVITVWRLTGDILLGLKLVKLSILPNAILTICLGQLERIKIKIFQLLHLSNHLMWYIQFCTCNSNEFTVVKPFFFFFLLLFFLVDRLECKYIDLYLIHSPHNGKIVDTWNAMCKLKEQGLVR